MGKPKVRLAEVLTRANKLFLWDIIYLVYHTPRGEPEYNERMSDPRLAALLLDGRGVSPATRAFLKTAQEAMRTYTDPFTRMEVERLFWSLTKES